MSFLAFLRDARWLTAQRVRMYSLMLVIGFAAVAGWVAVSQILIYRTPWRLGGDFLSFYTASQMALSGHAADAWNGIKHFRVERSLSPRVGYLAFFYPPAYLLLCWPLALLPYGYALLMWLLVPTTAATVMVRRLFRTHAPQLRIGLLPLLAFPAVLINLGCGQNGALALAIMAGGCLLLDRRPLLAGAVLGLLVIKPQLAFVLPIGLALAGRWRTFFATGVSAAVLWAAAWLAVGPAGYAAFALSNDEARATLLQGLTDPGAMQSLFAALRVFNVPIGLAAAAQGLLALGAMAACGFAAYRYRPDAFALMALIVATTVVATPFLLSYDLLITGLPIGWLFVTAAREGQRPWEALIALAAFALPLVARPLAQSLNAPVAPLVLIALLVAIMGRLRGAHRTISSDFKEKVVVGGHGLEPWTR